MQFELRKFLPAGNAKKPPSFESGFALCSGSWTRTSDLWVMSPTSYQLLHPAVSLNWSANIQQMFYRKQLFL